MRDCLLNIRNLTVRFGESSEPALRALTFDINEGEIVALLGASGAGKTTVALAASGALPSNAQVSGDILIRGVDILNLTRARLRVPQVSLAPQAPELALNPVMRVGKHIEEVLRANDQVSQERPRITTAELLEMTGLTEDLALAYPHQLSGGQRQRAVIAQCLASKPALLIADEPTSALDSITQKEILRQLKRVASNFKTTILLITHDPTILPGFADRVLVLDKGQLVESGDVGSVLKSPRHFCATRLVESVLPLPSATATDEKEADPAPAIIEMRGVAKTYRPRGGLFNRAGSVRALQHVDLQLKSGFALALAGRSGSGKSTLARCLTLLERPDAGKIIFRGKAINQRANRQLRTIRPHIQLIWQHSALSLNPHFRALDIVAEPLRLNRETRGRQITERALEMIMKTGLPDSVAERRPHELSGGQKQRLAIARALVLLPSVLVLDEPFAGLDLPLQREMIQLLLDLKTRFALSYLFITHDLRAAAAVADEVAVMQDGIIVECGRPESVFWRPQTAAARDLVAAACPIN